jgi:UDP-N-acetylenolpyruvoylglucosamine reductase
VSLKTQKRVENCSSPAHDADDYETEELTTIEQLSQFLDGTQAVIFKVNTLKEERYQWIQHELLRFDYRALSKIKKGVVIRYLIKVSDYTRQQITRLIKQYRDTEVKISRS